MNRTILVSGIILFGLFLRLVIFSASPPNNSFDDHLEPIMMYKNNMSIPLPNQCWECYQPPIYYSFCAVVLNGAEALNMSKFNSWRLVQLINPLVSVFVLFVFYRILLNLEVPYLKRILLLSFFAVLPIDLLTCSMIGNDYFLVLFSALTFYYFSRLCKHFEDRHKTRWLHYFLLCFFTVLGALTKQHGLLLIIFPASVLFLLFKNSSLKWRAVYSAVFLLTTLFSLSSEIQKFRVTGKFLVSNQDFYNYTNGQYPGDISRVEFFSFRFVDLMQNPYLSEKTSASFNTEIFARIFFDYEWRFLSPQANCANLVGQVAYVFGSIWVLFFVVLFVLRVRKLIRDSNYWSGLNAFFIISLVVLVLYALVPFVQTMRFPYFSSMKATFFLPGVIVFLTLVGRYLMKKSSEWLDYSLILVNLSFGFYFVLSIYNVLPLSLNQLSGPLWPIP
jgi:hypothetical protein